MDICNHKKRGQWAELRFMAKAAELGFQLAKPPCPGATAEARPGRPLRHHRRVRSPTQSGKARIKNAPPSIAWAGLAVVAEPTLCVNKRSVSMAFPEVAENDYTSDRRIRTPKRSERVPLEFHDGQQDRQVRR